MTDGLIYVTKEDFDRLQQFLNKPEIWSQRGAAQLANDLRYLEWTTEPPKEEGWYWVRANHWDGTKILDVMYLVIRDTVLSFDVPVSGYEWDMDFEVKDVTHWLGPLPMPEPPKE